MVCTRVVLPSKKLMTKNLKNTFFEFFYIFNIYVIRFRYNEKIKHHYKF